MSLAQQTRRTREKFALVASALKANEPHVQDPAPKHALEDSFERFQLWVGSVGASVHAEKKISLDWRLRDAPDIKEQVEDLLGDLVEALDDLNSITVGQRQNRTKDAEIIELEEEGSEYEPISIAANDESETIREVVAECIRGLLKLSILIRKATPRDRWRRALQKWDGSRLDENYDIRHVGEKFPKLNDSENEWLKNRLGRAITQRRQFMRYCREHRNQLSGYETVDPNQQPRAEEPPDILKTQLSSDPAPVEHNLNVAPPMTEAWTQASTLQVAKLEAMAADDFDDAVSVVSSIVSSVDVIDERDDTLQLPTLGAVNNGHEEFECPFCFTLQSFKQQRKWRKHAFADLKPYVCCCGKFECDLELFSDSKAWFAHELDQHRQHWKCFMCNKTPYDSLDLFTSHIKRNHPEIPAEQVADVAQLCKQPLEYIPAADCPFCNEFEAGLLAKQPNIKQNIGKDDTSREVLVVPAATFRRHVSSHLEQLALFALGTQVAPDTSRDSGSISSKVRSSPADPEVVEDYLGHQDEFERAEIVSLDSDQDQNAVVGEIGESSTGPSNLAGEEPARFPQAAEPGPTQARMEGDTNVRGQEDQDVNVHKPTTQNLGNITEGQKIDYPSEQQVDAVLDVINGRSSGSSLHAQQILEVRRYLPKVWRFVQSRAAAIKISMLMNQLDADPHCLGDCANEKDRLERTREFLMTAEGKRWITQQLATGWNMEDQFLADLQSNIIFRPGIKEVDLELTNHRHRLYMRGFLWTGNQGNKCLFLFDHYLIFTTRLQVGQDVDDTYQVEYEPIPLELLTIVSDNDDRDLDYEPSTLTFAFTIKHLGKISYRLSTEDAITRAEWVEAINSAKSENRPTLSKNSTILCELNVITGSAFTLGSETAIPLRAYTPDHLVYTALQIFSQRFSASPSVCEAKVNTSTTFNMDGRMLVAVGTDTGVFVTGHGELEEWIEIIHTPKVTQIGVLEEFSLLLIISNKVLMALNFDAPIMLSKGHQLAPQKLSGTHKVTFFTICFLEGRHLLLFCESTNITSTFKCLEPINSSKAKKSKFLRGARRDLFQEYDAFYVPTKTINMNVFKSTIAIATTKGLEVLQLNKKQLWSIPDFSPPHTTPIANVLRNQRPLGMYRLDDQEFLCCYEKNAVYVDRHGDLSRSAVIEYSSPAIQAILRGEVLILFHMDYVETRNAINGQLVQVIYGEDLHCINEGRDGSNIHIVMRHPHNTDRQLILEMKFHAEDAEG